MKNGIDRFVLARLDAQDYALGVQAATAVRVSAEQGVDRQAIFVPQRAVMRGPDGQARVLVVSAQGRAQERAVQTGAMQGAQWQVTQGLAAGDQVVVDGAAQIAPGTPRHGKQPDAQAPAQPPSR